jgi:ABC-type multidrug transport system ATPase subunit
MGKDVVNDLHAIRKTVGYMPGKFSLYQDLTVEENLNFFATLFGTSIKENYHLIEEIYVQLMPFKKRRAGKLSGGMKQKLALCCALIHKPEVLFLDEPTTGVDVVSRHEFWGMLQKLKNQGIAILVSTPYMDEANRCDRIALIQSGRILSVNTPEGIMQSFPKQLYNIHGNQIFHLLKELRLYPKTGHCFAFGDSIHFTFKNETEQSLDDLKGFLSHLKFEGISVEKSRAGIEDCFIELMQNH